jgi:large conductance mechanosensitive channel
MKKLLYEFKMFATSGNMLDLALGILIGAAFSGVVESLSKDIIGDLIACLGGAPDLSKLTWKVGSGEVHVGNFLGALINFIILAASLFMLVKIILRFKLANFRAQGSRECDFCKEFIAVDATKCKYCTADVEPLIRDED